MKIGIISDIHAYFDFLKTSVDYLESFAVHQILCAGDVLDGGEEGSRVVDLLKDREIASVQGNHDRDIFADQAELRRYLRRTNQLEHPFLLDAKTVAYATTLPLSQHFVFSGKSICLAHGTPWSNTTYLFPDMPDSAFHEVAEKANAEIVILGHTHMPMSVKVGEKWLFNPGSIYSNRFDDSRTCAILHLPEIRFEVFNLETKEPYPLKTRILAD